MTQTRPIRAKELSEWTRCTDTLSLGAGGRMGCKLRLPPPGGARTGQRLRGSTWMPSPPPPSWGTKASGRSPADLPALVALDSVGKVFASLRKVPHRAVLCPGWRSSPEQPQRSPFTGDGVLCGPTLEAAPAADRGPRAGPAFQACTPASAFCSPFLPQERIRGALLTTLHAHL